MNAVLFFLALTLVAYLALRTVRQRHERRTAAEIAARALARKKTAPHVSANLRGLVANDIPTAPARAPLPARSAGQDSVDRKVA